ncbi:MAG: formate/nitrite transporter family protein [Nitrospira sp.]|nr:formate/nitrite transporter family protein [Nitrospira sp.]MBX3337870.1 formate/nitrite transporter family protein [Nitrospira sp.]MCW5781406.1 formate/nitrite transporter family protein [Nitrospira sp.]HMZ55430.1 formate/nitrite transporter family protein [Nitrospira sp.]
MTTEPVTPASGSIADAYPPPEIAARVCQLGLAKVNTTVPTMVALAVLAGAFISLGALFYTVTITVGNESLALPFGVLRLVGGMTFSLGLILVVVGGAELFTGNNLIAMAWAARCVQTRQVVRNWVWVYLGNLLGAGGTAVLVLLAGVHTLGDGAVGETMVRIARGKVALDPLAAFVRGILCNVLVCLAVWLCMGARTVADKVLAILFPISAFVACGFEHSVANMFFLPLGFALTAGSSASFSILDALSNLALVTLGNIIGGTVLVALVYWFIYLRTNPEPR